MDDVFLTICKLGFYVGGSMAIGSFILGYTVFMLLTTFKHIAKY